MPPNDGDGEDNIPPNNDNHIEITTAPTNTTNTNSNANVNIVQPADRQLQPLYPTESQMHGASQMITNSQNDNNPDQDQNEAQQSNNQVLDDSLTLDPSKIPVVETDPVILFHDEMDSLKNMVVTWKNALFCNEQFYMKN